MRYNNNNIMFPLSLSTTLLLPTALSSILSPAIASPVPQTTAFSPSPPSSSSPPSSQNLTQNTARYHIPSTSIILNIHLGAVVEDRTNLGIFIELQRFVCNLRVEFTGHDFKLGQAERGGEPGHDPWTISREFDDSSTQRPSQKMEMTAGSPSSRPATLTWGALGVILAGLKTFVNTAGTARVPEHVDALNSYTGEMLASLDFKVTQLSDTEGIATVGSGGLRSTS